MTRKASKKITKPMTSQKLKGDEIPMMILTNERTQPKAMIIQMIYKAVAMGQLAYMDGKDPETGEVVPLLVGLEATDPDTNKVAVYPLARLLNKVDDIVPYLIPDGEGGYIDGRTDTTTEA